MTPEAKTETWIQWNAEGFFPGPSETEEEFEKRVSFCSHLEQELVQKVGTDLPFEVGDALSKSLIQDSFPLTQTIYGMRPSWVPVFFSNYQLTPWHGGCAWIFQLDAQTPMAAFLQLRAPFRTHSTYLGLYHRSELMAHELAHVGRMMYQEPQFEEFFAYRSSASFWRRWFGPIVQSSRESLLFMFLLGTLLLAQLALLGIQQPVFMTITWGLELAPLILLFLALVRLTYRHILLNRCAQQLKKLYGESEASQHLLYRLQDKEIRLFARSSLEKIQEYIRTQASHNFRWRFLQESYPLA